MESLWEHVDVDQIVSIQSSSSFVTAALPRVLNSIPYTVQLEKGDIIHHNGKFGSIDTTYIKIMAPSLCVL